MSEIDEIKNIIDNAQSIVFFGGAGVSTDSGIPDFRGNGGLYTDADGGSEDPSAILSAPYLLGRPKDFYTYYKRNMIYPYAEPNDAHLALAELERRGKLTAVITQNIDGLHQAAGSENVIELHGSVHRNYCVRCGKVYGLKYILESEEVPHCKSCAGLVRPDVVLYGESLDNEALCLAEDIIYNADVMIVGGTSLTVHPASSLVYDYQGEHLIIINKSPTPFDAYAEYVIRDSISDVLTQLVE